MLRFGTVIGINPKTVKAKVQFAQDSMSSYWLPVLQTRAYKDKVYVMPVKGEQVACLMDENSEEGVILGAIYTTENNAKFSSENVFSIDFSDGTFLNVSKESQTLTVSFPNINLVGNINHTGSFSNTDGITSDSDITDKKSSMQDMRNTYNGHTHTGNQGSPTSSPHQSM